MASKSKNKKKARAAFQMRLFIAGDSPNSRIARGNLRSICEDYQDVDFDITVIDVLNDPQTAMDLGVFITPALQVLKPEPTCLFFGNLSDHAAIHSLLCQETS